MQSDDPKIVIKPDGSEELAPPVMRVVGKVRHARDIQRADFEFLKANTRPYAQGDHPIADHAALSRRPRRHQPEGLSRPRAVLRRCRPAYGDELRSLAAAGCTYVQMDDTNLAYLCDMKMREAARARGDDPNELPHRYADFINRVVAQKPAGMTLAVHLCRGNFKSTHAAEGGYEPVAEALLAEMKVDVYFLEYDDERSGDFRPLRFLPKDKLVVLGLITTKLGALESKDDIKRRIDEAAKYVPLEQLALSPQCGFSSSYHGNDIEMSQQTAKLRLVVDIAREVWR